ncbi:MAG: transglycosylase SLT domain-containing protein, partial [bacterium]
MLFKVNYIDNNDNSDNSDSDYNNFNNNNFKIKKLIFNVIFLIVFFIISIFFINQVSNYLCPIRYSEAIDKYSKEYNLEKELVYSVINAESRFNYNALSNKGAVGLMQIMPSTGEWLIEKINTSLDDS